MINIAIDGPSGSGKSTVAKIISAKLGILYLDTGAMYRALALYARDFGADCKDGASVEKILPSVDISVRYENGGQRTILNGKDVSEEIRANDISMLASAVSAHKCVREKLVSVQRKIACERDCVLDGRDICKYVLPDAKFKFYMTADAGVRAERRFAELLSRNKPEKYEKVLADIKERDYNDMHRAVAPLVRADDAELIDTSSITAEQAADIIVRKVKEDAIVKKA